MSDGNISALVAGPTRRKVIAGMVAALGGLAAGPCVSGQSQANQEKMKEAQSTGVEGLLTYLHQEIDIKTSRQRIYDALLDQYEEGATAADAQAMFDAIHAVDRPSLEDIYLRLTGDGTRIEGSIR